ncbi:MAG: rhomboid family intramembrane serine protease [Polyangiaceae bacterium]
MATRTVVSPDGATFVTVQFAAQPPANNNDAPSGGANGSGASGGSGVGGSGLAPGWEAIGPFAWERGLREASLVLSSVGIEFETVIGVGGNYILVRARDAERARKNLASYVEENRDFPPRRPPERARYSGTPWLALAFVALVAFAWITGPVARPHGAFFAQGSSINSLVLSSEPFRAVTALTLHADGAHVLSNLLSGAVFGRALERRLGPGAAGLAILGAGVAGNVANAAFYAAQGLGHGSIGASTAVFGAVGALATTQFLMRDRLATPRDAKRTWVEQAAPFLGGLGLLGALGSSPETDIFAHAFGLLAGFVIAIPFALVARRSLRTAWLPQLALGAASLAIVGGSWALAVLT